MSTTPFANESNGRAANGRFGPGNTAAKGHAAPHARAVAALRRALLKTITPEALERVAAGLLVKAEAGDVAAAKLLLSYCIGRPQEGIDPDRIEQHETLIERTTPTAADRIRKRLADLHALDEAEQRAAESLGRGWRKWVGDDSDTEQAVG